jgi:hypothetical protein
VRFALACRTDLITILRENSRFEYVFFYCYLIVRPARRDSRADHSLKHWGETGGTLTSKDKEIRVRMGKSI